MSYSPFEMSNSSAIAANLCNSQLKAVLNLDSICVYRQWLTRFLSETKLFPCKVPIPASTTFRRLGPFMTRTILTKSNLTIEIQRLKLSRSRPLETRIHQRQVLFLILIISFDDYNSSLQAPTCPVKATIHHVSHKVRRDPPQPEVYHCKPQGLSFTYWRLFKAASEATTRYLCITLDPTRL